jgi:glycosyltransferase involved in cell wall biosynthesis
LVTISIHLSDDSAKNLNSPQKHILIIGLGLFEDYVGGISAYETNFARQLIARGYKVSAMIPRTKANLPAKTVTKEGVTIYRYGSATAPFGSLLAQYGDAPKTLQSILTTQKIHLINVHFALSAWGALKIPEAKKIPKLMHFHGPWPMEWRQEKQSKGGSLGPIDALINLFQGSIEREVVRRMDDIIIMSHAFQSYVQKVYQVRPDKLHIIPIGWDTEALVPLKKTQADARYDLGIDVEKRMIVCVRRLVKRTGVDMLIDALEPLVKTNMDLIVYIIGDGPEAENLKIQAKKLGIFSRVTFTGFIPDEQLALYYRAADVTVIPSRSLEGFGTIVLESLIQGTPLIATPVGALQEILLPLSPELLTKEPTSVALEFKLRNWLDKKLILPDDYTCRQYVAKSFHWDTLFPQVEAIFRKHGV